MSALVLFAAFVSAFAALPAVLVVLAASLRVVHAIRDRPRFSSTLRPTPSTSTGLPAATVAALVERALDRCRVAGAAACVGQAGRQPASRRRLRVRQWRASTPSPMACFASRRCFPFDEGRQYDVVLDAARLPAARCDDPWRTDVVAAVVGRPAVARSPSTVVTHLYPSGDVVPANQLRMYLHFSAPMDWRSGSTTSRSSTSAARRSSTRSCRSTRTSGTTIARATPCSSIPAASSAASCRTGRWARALDAGKRYTLVVKREWRDGHGLPLKEEFRHEFRAEPGDRAAADDGGVEGDGAVGGHARAGGR